MRQFRDPRASVVDPSRYASGRRRDRGRGLHAAHAAGIEIPLVSPQKRTPRGEFSPSSLRGVIAGSIERTEPAPPPRRKRSTTVPAERVHLAPASKRSITVIIGDQTLALERDDALALAQIVTSFA